MKRKSWQIVLMAAVLGLALAGPIRAQTDSGLTKMLVQSYDLLEAGKLAEAQKIFEQILKQDPGNPLALNNLGAIKVKENQYQEALAFLSQALPRAQGYKLKVNRVCDMQGLCLAFRPLEAVYGDQDLAPLVELNLSLVKAKLAEEKK
ncbi:MAG: tetratricopeptide repeat protein [Desulfobaccales bacterium]